MPIHAALMHKTQLNKIFKKPKNNWPFSKREMVSSEKEEKVV